MARRRQPDFNCPHCGEPVRGGARFCRACGADEESGWREDAEEAGAWSAAGYQADDEFDYDDFLRREFPENAKPGPSVVGIKRAILLVVVIAVCAAMVVTMWR